MKGFRKASLVFTCLMLLLGTGFCVSSATTYHSYTFTLNRGQGVTTGSVEKTGTKKDVTAGVIVTYSTAPGYSTTYYVKKADTNAIISDPATVQNKQWAGKRMNYKGVYTKKSATVRLYGIDNALTVPNGTRVSGQWTPQ